MRKVSTRVATIALIVVALAGAWLAYDKWGRNAPLPEGLIQANGRIEGDRITVASKFAGRVAELLVSEGDGVTASPASRRPWRRCRLGCSI